MTYSGLRGAVSLCVALFVEHMHLVRGWFVFDVLYLYKGERYHEDQTNADAPTLAT